MHERDPINFDFRVVVLLTALISNPDLLHEYVSDAKLDSDDPKKWNVLTGLGFSADLLGDLSFLFLRHDVAEAMVVIQRLYRTMSAIVEYCEETCPDYDWLRRYMTSTRQIPQSLKPAGVEIGGK